MTRTLAEKVKIKARELSATPVNPKAFVIDVYRALVESGDIVEGDLDDFKYWLVSMHRRSILMLGRCNMAPDFEPEKVKHSVVRYMGAEFYFIRG